MTKPQALNLAKAAGGPRRGLSRVEAAVYVGISSTKFNEMVADGRMPGPKRIDARKVWDIRALDRAFDELPGSEDDAGTSWDAVFSDPSTAPIAEVPPVVFPQYGPGEWEKQVCAKPMGKREVQALGEFYKMRNAALHYVKGTGLNTTERLKARGFVTVAEERGDRVPFHRITPEGEAAWLAMSNE